MSVDRPLPQERAEEAVRFAPPAPPPDPEPQG